jgi:predicted DNA-binding protein YlxM (UPF0122 family)
VRLDDPTLNLGSSDNQDGDKDPFDALDGAEAVRSDDDDPLVERPADPALDAIEDDEDGTGNAASAVGDDVNNAQCRWCREEFRGVGSRRFHDCPDRETTPAPEPTVHQVGAHLFWDCGTDAYWSVVDVLEDAEDENRALNGRPVNVDGATWHVQDDSLSVWADGVRIPDHHDRSERRAREATIRLVAPPTHDGEWRDVDTEDLDARGVTFIIKPAWPEMRRARDGEPAGGIPSDIPAGIRVSVDASSVHPELFVPAWRGLLAALALNDVSQRCTLKSLHGFSTATAASQYVRLDRQVAQQHLVEDGMLFDRLSRVARASGGRGWLAWDDRDTTGHLTDLALDHQTTTQLFGTTTHVGGLWHCYHPMFVRGESVDADSDDPLADPKLEVAWTPRRDRTEERGVDVFERDSVPFHDPDRVDLFDVLDDLDRLLVTTLDWAGIDLGDEAVWTADPYFVADVSDRRLSMVANPLADLEREETSLVDQLLATGSLTDAQRAVVATVVTEGVQHWSELVEQADVSRSTVYDAVNAVGDILEVVDGMVRTTDEVIHECLRESLEAVGGHENFVAGEVDPLESRIDGFGEDSALARWARRHAGVDVQFQNGDMTVDLGREKRTGPEVRRLLRAGINAADLSGLGDKFMSATFRWSTLEGREERPHAQGVWDGVSGSPRPYGITVGSSRTARLGSIG